MYVDSAEVEGDYHALIRMAGLDPYDSNSIWSVCVGLTGNPPIDCHGRASYENVDGDERIIVCGSLPGIFKCMAVAHEISHVYMKRIGKEPDNLEDICDSIGAALGNPFHVMRKAVRFFGVNPMSIRMMAGSIGVTESAIVLRLAELQHVRVGIVDTGKRVISRGAELNPNVSDEQLRMILKSDSVCNVYIGDQRGFKAGYII
jgi:hypothetical protein